MPLAGRASGSPPSTSRARQSPDGIPSSEDRSGWHGRARLAALAAILVVGAVAVALVAQPHSPTPGRRGTAIPAGETTPAVERRTLAEHAHPDRTRCYAHRLRPHKPPARTLRRA